MFTKVCIRCGVEKPFTEFHKHCTDRFIQTGVKWSVDHIVPINHKDACGLNNAFNLQVTPANWNYRKRNLSMDTYFPIRASNVGY